MALALDAVQIVYGWFRLSNTTIRDTEWEGMVMISTWEELHCQGAPLLC